MGLTERYLKINYLPFILIIGAMAAGIFLMSAGKNDNKNQVVSTESGSKKIKPAPEGKRTDKKFSWEMAYAKATEAGDLEWSPKAFVFEAGKSIRYIDFEQGNDSNTGLSKSSPWKHHPWDTGATGLAAICTGIQTYVFRRGSVYRGSMIADESGEPGNPIRLSVDPSWGEGEAVISGSVKITGGWVRGADNKDIPEPAKVWYRDLDFAPRNIWMIKDKEIKRIPLARMPNWKISDPEDIKSEWWYWDYPGSKYFSVFMKNEQGRELILGIDTKNLTGPKECQGCTSCPDTYLPE